MFVYVIVEDGDGNNCIFSRLLAENCDMLMRQENYGKKDFYELQEQFAA